MSPRRRAPRPISGAIGKIVEESAPQTMLAQVQRAWPNACGPAVAAEADPIAESGGVITVRCHSAVWAAELEMMQAEVLAKLSEELSGPAPEGLRFVVGEE